MAINIKFDGKVNSKYTIKLSDIINNPSNLCDVTYIDTSRATYMNDKISVDKVFQYKNKLVFTDSKLTMAKLAKAALLKSHLLNVAVLMGMLDVFKKSGGENYIENTLKLYKNLNHFDIYKYDYSDNESYKRKLVEGVNTFANSCTGHEFGFPYYIHSLLYNLVSCKALSSDLDEDSIELVDMSIKRVRTDSFFFKTSEKYFRKNFETVDSAANAIFVYDDTVPEQGDVNWIPASAYVGYKMDFGSYIARSLSIEEKTILACEYSENTRVALENCNTMVLDNWQANMVAGSVFGLLDLCYSFTTDEGIELLLKIVDKWLKYADELIDEHTEIIIPRSIANNDGYNTLEIYTGFKEVTLKNIRDIIASRIDLANSKNLKRVIYENDVPRLYYKNKSIHGIDTDKMLYSGSKESLKQFLAINQVYDDSIHIVDKKNISSAILKAKVLGFSIIGYILVPFSAPLLVMTMGEKVKIYHTEDSNILWGHAQSMKYWLLKGEVDGFEETCEKIINVLAAELY